MDLNDALDLIKPKRLYENKMAFIHPDKLVLELGATSIVVPAQTGYPNAWSTVKDLFSNQGNIHRAEKINAVNYPTTGWNELIITAQDLTIFSAISAAGEDTFFIGKIDTAENKLLIRTAAYTYYCSYAAPKILPAPPFLDAYIDWQVYYYLFQMFKHLSGKKLDKLLWQVQDNVLWLTNEAQSYYIRVYKNQSLMFNSTYFKYISDYYKNLQIGEEGTQVVKKGLGEGGESLIKHLTRPFGDTMLFRELEKFNVYWNNSTYALAINKVKENE